MRFSIVSKKMDETFDFWASNNGGYIHQEIGDRIGTMGRQLCNGGEYSGEEISTPADESKFRSICRCWYRAYYRKTVAWMALQPKQ